MKIFLILLYGAFILALGMLAGFIIFSNWGIIMMLSVIALFIFFKHYDKIRLIWSPKQSYIVVVYEYTSVGTRNQIWNGNWMSYNECRAAGQAVCDYIQSQTNQCNYTYAVTNEDGEMV